ncbi:MAG TPA: addiction module protein [Puia sp.]|nr:addiction module protein [Puia sp.]
MGILMAPSAIRRKLITYLADADDKKVKAIYALFEDEINQEDNFKLTDEHLKIVEERRAKHLSGKSKSYTWQEVHDSIRKKRKANGA